MNGWIFNMVAAFFLPLGNDVLVDDGNHDGVSLTQSLRFLNSLEYIVMHTRRKIVRKKILKVGT